MTFRDIALRPTVAAGLALLLTAGAASAQIPVLVDTIEAPEPSISEAYFGFTIVALGDVDGDGTADLLVGGEAAASGGVFRAGRAYVLSGATRATLDTLVSPTPTDQGFYSSSMAALGDLDGDGVEDFVIGGEGDVPDGGIREGAAYVYSGATRALLRTLRSPEPVPFGAFGAGLAAAGDLTGDGVQEILVGAFGERNLSSSGGFGSGQAHVFDGATGALVRTVVPPEGFDDGFSFAYFGHGVTLAPDLDGDGTRDHAIFTRFGNDENGVVEFYSGADGAYIRGLTRDFGNELADFGLAILPAPDLDGDGTADLLIGAPGAEEFSPFPPFEGAGVVYLYSGATFRVLREFRPPLGPEPGGFGVALALAPDLDGDGVGDLYVGAPGTDVSTGGPNPVANAGRVYAVSMATGTVLYAFESPDPEFIGVFGYALATLDTDGPPSFFVGAPLESGRRGRLYVYEFAGIDAEGDAEAAFALYPVTPNPVDGQATIRYDLAEPADVRLDVYDARGRRLATLVDAARPAGPHAVAWDTRRLPSGTYVYRLRAGASVATLQATVIR